jgi:RNA polymerase sigma factor (sigma-70 family)
MITQAEISPRPVHRSTVRYEEDRRYVLGVLGRRCPWLESSQREDLFHDAYLVLLEKRSSGALAAEEMAAGQVRAYLTQTAINKALDQGKWVARRRPVSLDRDDCAALRSPEPAIEERVIAREDARRLQDAMTLLPERQQRVLKLRYFLGCEPRQIQERLGVSRDVYRHELERGTRAVTQAFACA